MNIHLIAKRHRPLLTIGKEILTCHFGSLYLLNISTGQASKVCSLPVKSRYRFLARFRPLERLLRLEVKAAIALSDTVVLISYLGSIYRVDISSGEIIKEHDYCSGMNNPLYFTRIEGITGFEDCIAYGEYTINSNRKNASAIYIRSLSTPNWCKVYEFPAGEVRHIHGLKAALGDDCVYIMTGDLDNESGIWVSRDGFHTITPVLTGKQKYRTGFMFTVSNGYVYPTDTATEQNYIYLAEYNDAQLNLRVLAKLDGSCVNAIDTETDIFITTAVEPDENITGWRSWINYKKGAGIKSDRTQLLKVDKKSMEYKNIFSAKKDILPYRLFQYGSMILVDCPHAGGVMVYPIGVKKFDGKLLLLSCESEEEYSVDSK